MQPKILILDEPTAGLDPLGRDEILENIYKLKKEQNISIILVSHSMEEVAKYADKVLVLSFGELILFDKAKDVFKKIDLLESVGLRAPEINYIVRALKKNNFDIDENITSIKECKEAILQLIRKDKND